MPCCCGPASAVAVSNVLAGGPSPGAAAAPPAPASPPTSGPATTQAGAGVANLGSTAPAQLLWPVKGNITDGFGVVSELRGSRPHGGIDISAGSGTTIKAADDGVVVDVRFEPNGGGNLTVVRHAGNLFTVYAHQSKVDVREGDSVTAGQKIGEVGSTGFSTGPHLHFEVHQGSPTDGKVDPQQYLP